MNIFETEIEAEKPQGVLSQSIMLYVPEVTSGTKGIVGFDALDFIISQGIAYLNKLNVINNSNNLVTSSAVKNYVDNNFVTKTVYDAKIAAIDEDIVAIDEDIAAIGEDITAIDEDIAAIEETLDNMQDSIEDLNTNKANKSYVDETFVTLNTNQTIVGTKSFSLMKLISNLSNDAHTLISSNGIQKIDGANEYDYDFPNASGVFALNGDISYLNQKIDAIQGKGGYLLPYNFGTATPSETQLNNYALTQITNIDDPIDIFNGTRVTNKYDNHTWLLNNTPDTTPAVFEWVDLGFEYASVATNNTLGIVKGSSSNLKVNIDANGEMSVNGLSNELQTISTNISTLDDDINNVSTGLKARVSQVETVLGYKANKSTIATYTLSSANWSNNQYILTPTGKTSSNNADVYPWQGSSTSDTSDVEANNELIKAAEIGQIIDNGTTLTLVCKTTPTDDIKVTVEVYE